MERYNPATQDAKRIIFLKTLSLITTMQGLELQNQPIIISFITISNQTAIKPMMMEPTSGMTGIPLEETTGLIILVLIAMAMVSVILPMRSLRGSIQTATL